MKKEGIIVRIENAVYSLKHLQECIKYIMFIIYGIHGIGEGLTVYVFEQFLKTACLTV